MKRRKKMGLALALIAIATFGGTSIFVLYLNRGEDIRLADIPNLLRVRFGRFSRFFKVFSAKLDAQEFIMNFVKVDAVPTVDPAAYSLTSVSGSGHSVHGFYADGKHSVVLGKHDCGYIALIGFDLSDGVVLVKQIQGRQGYREHLAPLKWERMLLAVVVKVAREAGLKEVRVQPARNNEWGTVRGQAVNGRGKMLYDVTARRSGFKFDQEEDCFRLALV